jgi:hypothetical protein
VAALHLAVPSRLVFFHPRSGRTSLEANTRIPAASNFPDHRGTATAFPLAAFGLSALFWSNVSTLIFKEDTGRFLLLLALGTSILSFCSIPLLRIFPIESYSSLPHYGPGDPGHSQRMRRASNVAGNSEEHNSTAFDHERSAHARTQSTVSNYRASGADSDETSSLVSKPDGRPSFDTLDDDFLGDVAMEAHHTDIRGLAMLRHVEFWQLFLTMALLSGIGLMTIK